MERSLEDKCEMAGYRVKEGVTNLCSPQQLAAQIIRVSTKVFVLQGTHDLLAVACRHIAVVGHLKKTLHVFDTGRT